MKTNFLSARRKQLGLTTKEIAAMVGVNNGTISRWESGEIASMRTDKLVAYAQALQVSPLVIMGLEPPEEKEKSVELEIAKKIIDSYDLKALFEAAIMAKEEDIRFATEMLRRMSRK